MPDIIARLNAALAGRYQIERELGQGGMATVFLTADLKHDRKVALKVLKPELAAVLGADRFVVEIKTTASLQHPHILPLFDSGTADGFLFYVMPFIDGETLREKLSRETQLGVEEAVRIATDVADALAYAHEHGVIHRDIKPENILLQGGRPMVADFGIALAVSAAAGGRMTETGLSLGTPHYMSPEQATAVKEITARSDVYSLGSVLYEMLAGQPPHIGGSAQQIIMKIIAEPTKPVEELRSSVPPNVAAAVAKSLEKLPADRFETAKAFRDALGDASFARFDAKRGTQVAGFAHTGVSRRVLYTAVALNAVWLATIAAGWMHFASAPSPSRQQVVLWKRSSPLTLAPGRDLNWVQAALSPDGSSIVYTDSTPTGMRLMRKQRQSAVAEAMPGTELGYSPFFSPDGEWVGYITADGKLRKTPVIGGGSVTLLGGVNRDYSVATWLDDQTIVFVDSAGNLRRVPAAGGASRDFRRLERLNVESMWPLPGNRGLLLTACPGNCTTRSDVYVYDARSDSLQLLVENAAGAWYAPTGQFLYTNRSGGLYAADFDLSTLHLRSAAVLVIDSVRPNDFTLSPSGSALYTVGASDLPPAELVWVSRAGVATAIDPEWRGQFDYPALSPDGSSLAVSVRAEATQLWIRRSDGSRQMLTHEGTVNWRPSWMPDGRSVSFISNRGGTGSVDYAVYQSPVDGSAPPRKILSLSVGVWESEISRDGKWMVVRSDESQGGRNLRARRLDGDTTLLSVAVDRYDKTQGALSPDGRWLAFRGDESGRSEIYVVSFPDGRLKRVVSRGGGSEPRWSHSGRELFFKSGGKLVVLDVPTGPAFTPGVPRPLFPLDNYRAADNRQEYDVAPGDQRFVMIREREQGTSARVYYVEHWLEELKAKMRGKH